MKICKNCKYYREAWLFDAQCERSRIKGENQDKVTGKIIKWSFTTSCRKNREYNGDCGIKGSLFEPKESFWKRFFNKKADISIR